MENEKSKTGSVICQIKRKIKQISFKGSQQYWENRYEKGGSSGAGSYGKLAEFKAGTVNSFIRQHEIKSVIEWGCGDGNQLSLMNCDQYIGLDVAQSAINICKEKFKSDRSKTFFTTEEFLQTNQKLFDLALSMDVVYHLVEDEVYIEYMKNLFQSAAQYVCIYSSDRDQIGAVHVRERHFTEYVEKVFLEWKIFKIIENQYPYDPNLPTETSLADFYFYCRA